MGVARKAKKSVARELGFFFRSKRREAGLTEGAAADYLNCDLDTFLQYESGERSLPLNAAYALANFLNIEPDELLRTLVSLQKR